MRWHVEHYQGGQTFFLINDEGTVRKVGGRAQRFLKLSTAQKIADQLNGVYRPDRYYRERCGEQPS